MKNIIRKILRESDLDWVKNVKSRLPLRVGTCLTFKHSKEEEEWVEDEYGNMIDHGKMNWHITSKFIDVYNDDKPTFSMVATDRMGESRQIFMEVEKVKELYEEGVYEPCKKQPYLKRVMKEYNTHEKRSTTEITMSLLHEASDHFAEGLRLIESATQFAYESNNEDLIRDLEKLRMSIQSGGDKMWAERPNSINIVNRINDIIKKYS